MPKTAVQRALQVITNHLATFRQAGETAAFVYTVDGVIKTIGCRVNIV